MPSPKVAFLPGLFLCPPWKAKSHRETAEVCGGGSPLAPESQAGYPAGAPRATRLPICLEDSGFFAFLTKPESGTKGPERQTKSALPAPLGTVLPVTVKRGRSV